MRGDSIHHALKRLREYSQTIYIFLKCVYYFFQLKGENIEIIGKERINRRTCICKSVRPSFILNTLLIHFEKNEKC